MPPAMAANGERRRMHILLDAFEPSTNGVCKVQISYRRMQAVAKRGIVQASECAFIVPAILLHPEAVFEGIRRDEDEDKHEGGAGWQCYCGIPASSYRTDGSAAPPYADEVYLVFINSERIAYNWRWEKCDPDDPRLPKEYAERFKRRIK
jgi:hypothetical protein